MAVYASLSGKSKSSSITQPPRHTNTTTEFVKSTVKKPSTNRGHKVPFCKKNIIITLSPFLRCVQTMLLCSLGQGAVSPWTIVPRCPRVLQMLPTMSDSSLVSQLLQSQLPDIVGSTCNTLGQRGTMLHGEGTLPLVPRAKLHRLNGPLLLQISRTSFYKLNNARYILSSNTGCRHILNLSQLLN